jgi:putative glutamine amidotransferase
LTRAENVEDATVPRIGITADPTYNVDEYVRAVTNAGGEAVVLLPDPARAMADAGAFDALVFSGGEDIDPARYGEAPHPATHVAAAARDDYEIALARAAFERGVPVLAICRGLQIANVALGGTLVQHVPDRFGERIAHRLVRDGASHRGLIDAHAVAVDAGTRLAAIAGPSLVTGSRHHQAVGDVAAPLRAVARTPDGVIEALEPRAEHPFWLAVQWHPESTIGLDRGESAALFRGLVEAARATSR